MYRVYSVGGRVQWLKVDKEVRSCLYIVLLLAVVMLQNISSFTTPVMNTFQTRLSLTLRCS